ncbi:MAG: saccharopine dehydrogenase NADP-binding domain-containing protein [Actinomycetota bacterium]|nr:saccharopine dehydrogenase NADP-binding domain-containing protein [Actinomycetota bacterium]
MRIVVLGGAGKMGAMAVEDLVINPRVDEVILADRDMEGAAAIAGYLDSPKLTITESDLNDHEALVALLEPADACLNATVYYTNMKVMEACLEAGTHYTDMGGLFHGTLKQLELTDRFTEAGISAVLGMGSAPGAPNILARYAADRLDTIDAIKIYDGVKPPPPGTMKFTYAAPTIIDELTQQPMIFRGGEFIACEPLTEFEDYPFAGSLGHLPMHLSLHSEVATLPVSFADKGVQECFFKINYWGMDRGIVEKVRVLAEFGFDGTDPISVGGVEVSPRDFTIEMMGDFVPSAYEMLVTPANEPGDWAKEIVSDVTGTIDGEPVRYRMGVLTLKGALPTGTLPARAATWMAAGKVAPGVHPPELAFDPEPFLKELEERGIETQVTVTRGL